MKASHQYLCILLCLAVSFAAAEAATFYVDPVNGSMAGDGSVGNPWSTLAEVISGGKIESMKPVTYPYLYGAPLVAFNVGAPVQPGDTLELLSGDHGDVYALGYFHSDWVTIKAADGHTPVVRRFQFRGGRKWRIDGVTVSQEPYGTPGTITAVNFENHGWHGPCYDCIIENSHIYGVDDTSAFAAADWLSQTPGGGVSSGGPRNIIRNNTIRNVQLAVSVNGDDSVIEYNTLTGIAHDGFRSGGDRIIWQYNNLSDFVDVDGNHDDMIQMYRGGGVPHVGVEIRGNYFDGRMIAGRPLSTSPQGVGCFDGPYVDCIVENNIVFTAHWHGITLNDADGCKIINNTVLDPSRGYPAWITLPDEDTFSHDCIVRNNMSYSIPNPDAVDNIVVDHNIELTDAQSDLIFVDWRNGDVHLLPAGLAVDAGAGTDAPNVDIDGVMRPQGSGWDIGAYESVPANQAPVADAGADQTVTDDDGEGTASATLDGSGSTDSDGTIASYEWDEDAAQIATGVSPTVTLAVGVHTIDLTVTDDDSETDSDSVVVTAVSRTLVSSTDAYTWPTSTLPTQTGVFTVEFDAVPSAAGMDGVTGLSSGPGDWWTDLACIVRFSTADVIDVRNGGAYAADTNLAYSADTTYHVRMVVDIPNATYSVYITPQGQSETALATDYAFRTEQASITSIDHWTLNAAFSTGPHTVSNLTITE